ncbi:MAG: F0F1 ATP synthase subunit beta [Candidatus Omnitrophota bacterium]|nr:MAG: F0F1 ATP synthase subunit beta [Candidatus Omnitrophota bacterium]
MQKGKVIAVIGPVVIVKFPPNEPPPAAFDILETKTYDGKRVVLEVVEYHLGRRTTDLGGHIARCIPLTPIFGLQRNAEVISTGSGIKTPVGKEVCSRILNVLGEPIDKRGSLGAKLSRPTHKKKAADLNIEKVKTGLRFEVMETGIKVLDLLFPLIKGTRTGILGGAALGKSILILELMHNIIKKQKGYCVFTGAGERIREGNELYTELSKQEILDRSILVFGQMNESPGARFEVVHTGITLAEYFQEEREDVLFFVDSVYRFAQAGSELSTLLGRIPSETGYQPTLTSEMSDFQERIRSGGQAAITAIEAVYVPSDDLTDPAVVCIFSYLDSMLILSRQHVQLGLYPAIDPLLSSCSYLDPLIVGRRHFAAAQEALRVLNRYEELRRIVSIIGIEELSKEDRVLFERAQRLRSFLTQPFFTAELYTGKKGEYVPLDRTLDNCERIVSGEWDKRSAEELYMIGAL